MRFFIDFSLIWGRFWLHFGSQNNQKTHPEPHHKHIEKKEDKKGHFGVDLALGDGLTRVEWRQGGGPWMLVFGQNRPIKFSTPTAPARQGAADLRAKPVPPAPSRRRRIWCVADTGAVVTIDRGRCTHFGNRNGVAMYKNETNIGMRA